MNAMPTLESLLGEEKLREMQASVSTMATETYQPLLDMVVEKFGYSNMQAELVADVTLVLKEEDGKPVVDNNISFDIKFHPVLAPDTVEQIHRELVKMAFASVIEKQK